MSHAVLVLWGAVVAGAVLGRIIEHEPEVIEENLSLSREQAHVWSREFFGTSQLKGRVHTEVLSDHPDHHLQAEHRGRNERYSYASSLYANDVNSRINTRSFDVDSVQYPSTGKSPTIKQENLEWMLQNIFMYPRSHSTNETAKEYVRKYITDSLQLTSGLYTIVQHFQPMQFLTMYEHSSVPMGANIIGIIKGKEWSTPNDRPLVVGAHWDTVNFTPGTDDNGSGVASMLEVARAISHSGCRPKYSMLFVAFDLEEVGSQGSLVFIKEYLMSILKSNFPKEVGMARFQGAFIMDTIMDFNDTEGSQTFPTDWSLVMPEVYGEVADEKYKGDFLSMIYRKDVDARMADRFKYHWSRSSHDQKFKLKPFPLTLSAELPQLEVLADHLNLLRSDHSRFWYMNDSAVPHTLNAILVTDTGPYRGNMRNCYHTVCDGPEVSMYQNPTNVQFLAKITQVLTDTLVDMGECDLEDSRKDLSSASTNSIKTSKVNAKNSSYRHGSPLRNLLNFVKWMQMAPSANS